ncbi:MAG: hypothetical protein IPL71_06415 [Anaerolineales bacterium]|uniref:hypothetical protein n=1 Tax=Candidatus Villigracilis proximus TaxID=3140683 RepID=UPI003136BF53|nr:hypothetical protein [Anaerolineales bacterium]
MKLDQFEKQQYLNVETFRKNGQGLKLRSGLCRMEKRFKSGPRPGRAKPSGFATMARSALRLRQPLVNPPASGRTHTPKQTNLPESIKHVETLMKKKYGVMFYIFGFIGRMRGGAKYTAIKIQA